MKVFIHTKVDDTWPVHVVEVQTDAGVVLARGESQNYPGRYDATVQKAARDCIYNMERQLKAAREHMVNNGLLKDEK